MSLEICGIVLCVWGASSWLRTRSLTSSTFAAVQGRSSATALSSSRAILSEILWLLQK